MKLRLESDTMPRREEAEALARTRSAKIRCPNPAMAEGCKR
ncbi:MAG: hypothetical protein R3B47_06625 [Bacteroidia bacterium]